MAKKILIISPTPSHPRNSGSRARVYNLLRGIQELGHDLYFLYIDTERGSDIQLMKTCWGDRFYYLPYSKPRSKSNLVKIARRFLYGHTLFIDDWYDPHLDNVLCNYYNEIQFDVVIVEYVFFSKALECFGQETKKLIDTIDVFSNRHERMIQQGIKPNWYSATLREEARGLNRADLVIAISEEDHKLLYQLVPKKVVTISHIVQVIESPRLNASRTGKILFLGSANPMNLQAIRFFLAEVLPLIRLKYPLTQTLVAGSVCKLIEDRPDCVKMGEVVDLRPAYEAVDLVINPMLFGTGVSIKSLEALSYSKPLITTSIGARGLGEGANKAFLLADTPEEFALAVIRVLSDENLSASLSTNAYVFISHWNARNKDSLTSLFND